MIFNYKLLLIKLISILSSKVGFPNQDQLQLWAQVLYFTSLYGDKIYMYQEIEAERSAHSIKEPGPPMVNQPPLPLQRSFRIARQ